MKKPITYLMSMLLVVLPLLSSSVSVADAEKDEDRLKNSGTTLEEILDIPRRHPPGLARQGRLRGCLSVGLESRIRCRRKLRARRDVLSRR